jgi:hypothetical protein
MHSKTKATCASLGLEVDKVYLTSATKQYAVQSTMKVTSPPPWLGRGGGRGFQKGKVEVG